MHCKWLPDFYKDIDWNNYAAFEEELYIFFREKYLNKPLFFHHKIVKYRYKPILNDKEDVFYHLISKNYESDSERSPDPNRIIRISWTRAFIENHCCIDECCESKPLYWSKMKGNKLMHKILFEKFLVILEERDEYFLLITGYYVEEEYYMKGLMKEYQSVCKAKSAT